MTFLAQSTKASLFRNVASLEQEEEPSLTGYDPIIAARLSIPSLANIQFVLSVPGTTSLANLSSFKYD